MLQQSNWETLEPIIQAHHQDLHQLSHRTVVVEGISYTLPEYRMNLPSALKRAIFLILTVVQR